MDNYPIKSVTFGGFDKQDVIHYIEKTAQETAEVQKKLQDENDGLCVIRMPQRCETSTAAFKHLQLTPQSISNACPSSSTT